MTETTSFCVGDKVVHPNHGAGIVVEIEDEEFVDGFSEYYVIELAAAQRRLMIPVSKAEDLGLRLVINEKTVEEIYDTLTSPAEDLPNNFKKRKARVTEHLKSGDLTAIAGVVRNYFWRDREKDLSATDTKIYERAKQMLAGELALAEDTEVETIMEQIELDLTEALPAEE